MDIIKSDEGLRYAFQPIHGKETNILTAFNNPEDQNMLAWITIEVKAFVLYQHLHQYQQNISML